MLLGVLIAASVTASDQSSMCDIRLGDLVPTADVAKEIAEVIIRSREAPDMRSRYVLHVEEDPDGDWIAYQALPDPPTPSDAKVIVIGGGGLGMHISGCNGRMTSVFYQR